MSPQLLSKVNRKASVVFAHDSLIQRPKLSPYVANVIATWAYSDAAYASMVTHFLKADFRIVHEMLHTLRSTDARRQIIQAAAEEALQSEDLEIFNAVKKCTSSSRTKRNDFAHCLWGTSEALPDALLLANPKITTEYDVYMALSQTGRLLDKKKELRRFDKQFDNIYVYRKNDLVQETEEAAWACRQISLLLMYLSRRNDTGREQAHSALLAEPRIQDCIASLSQKNNPESQPPSPRQDPPEKR